MNSTVFHKHVGSQSDDAQLHERLAATPPQPSDDTTTPQVNPLLHKCSGIFGAGQVLPSYLSSHRQNGISPGWELSLPPPAANWPITA